MDSENTEKMGIGQPGLAGQSAGGPSAPQGPAGAGLAAGQGGSQAGPGGPSQATEALKGPPEA